MNNQTQAPDAADHMTTIEVAGLLGLAVRSIQMMVDRGELQAWKTPGGHRRISRRSVQAWLDGRRTGQPMPALVQQTLPPSPTAARRPSRLRVLVIEDSVHHQNLLALLLKQHLPDADVHIADDGITGLAMAGRLDPDVLIIDILLPGIDGATLITSLRSHPQFRRCQLIVVTSIDDVKHSSYAFALVGIPVVHKTKLVSELPRLLSDCVLRLTGHAGNTAPLP